MAPQPDTTAETGGIITGLSQLAPRYDVLLCDVWGVLHNGQSWFKPAAEALTRFRAGGGTVVLITNAPRPNGPIRTQLDAIGVPKTAYDAVVTSGDVTLSAIVAHRDTPLVHIGPDRDLALLDEAARLSGTRPPLVDVREAGYAVVTGLKGDELGKPEDYDADLRVMRDRGLTLICANPDLVVHVGTRLRYCAGAIAERFQGQGGQVLYAGKPHAPIYEASLAAAAEARGTAVDRSRVLAIGDALRTDVAGAVLQGLDVLFITSGIHADELHRTGDGQLDPDAYQRSIEAAEHRPLAAIPALTW